MITKKPTFNYLWVLIALNSALAIYFLVSAKSPYAWFMIPLIVGLTVGSLWPGEGSQSIYGVTLLTCITVLFMTVG